MRNRFDQQLAKLDEELTHMGELCETAITRVVEALEMGSKQQAQEVIEADDEIDHMEKEIERLCLKLLLQQQPVAKDLRRISAALKMITDMERIGDQTADIAEIVISANLSGTRKMGHITAMTVAVKEMVHESVQAYVRKDLEMAKKVEESDDTVDKLFEIVRDELIDFISKEKGKDAAEAIDLFMVAKYMERLGDHATNIAEWVEFSITGVHRDSQ